LGILVLLARRVQGGEKEQERPVETLRDRRSANRRPRFGSPLVAASNAAASAQHPEHTDHAGDNE
jgi:hypothetical protein